MKMKSSLFSVSNESGHVLQICIVPSDDRTKAASVFVEVWKHHQRPLTKYIYTDNVIVGKLLVSTSSNSH